MAKRLVDMDYEELKEKMYKAKEANDHRKTLDYCIALSSKFFYSMDLDKEWCLEQQIREIDEILANMDENRPDREYLINKLTEVKSLILKQLENVRKELSNYK